LAQSVPRKEHLKATGKIEMKEDVINQLMQWLPEVGLAFHPITPDRDVTQDGTDAVYRSVGNQYDKHSAML
jgi:hypothetical protein